MTDPALIAAEWTAAGATTLAVVAALYVAHRDWRRADKDHRLRQEAQARLLMITADPGRPLSAVVQNCAKEPVLALELIDAARADREEGDTWGPVSRHGRKHSLEATAT